MKKTIAILLVLVIGMVGVWAANDNDTTLMLNSTVSGKYGLKIDSTGVTGATLSEKIASFNNLTEVASTSFNDGDLTETLYVNYMSNQKIKATVTTSMLPMSSNTVTSKIGYGVTVGTTTTEVPADAESGVAITFIEDAVEINGMRVVSQAFTINVDSTEWQAAGAAADYTTTWTVTLATI